MPRADNLAPQAPATLADTGIEPAVLADLTLKTGYTVPHFTTEWAARRLQLPLALLQNLLEQLRQDRLVEALGQSGPFSYRFALTQRGREQAGRMLEVSGYTGPAPVSLPAYTDLLEKQLTQLPPVRPENVRAALSSMVLTPEAAQLAGITVASGRSLIVHGPPGNGKTMLGRLRRDALEGELWIPHSIAVGHSIIRVFDEQAHEEVAPVADSPGSVGGNHVDGRWVRIRRPFVVVGGEATIHTFDLTYSPTLRYYEAPLHFKANGGLFLIDDFGRERIDPQQLMNRWITPLEHQIDYLTLQTGQKVQIPIRLILVLATNIDLEKVTDSAFLRRLGYRLYLGPATPEQYARIFERFAADRGVAVSAPLMARLLERYRAEGRELRCCEPRDLINRAQDICAFHGRPLELTDEVMDLAWVGYFGSSK